MLHAANVSTCMHEHDCVADLSRDIRTDTEDRQTLEAWKARMIGAVNEQMTHESALCVSHIPCVAAV